MRDGGGSLGRSQDELGLEGTLGESGGSGWMPYTMHRYQDGTYGWMEPLREGWDEVSKPVSHPPPEPVDHESWWVAGFLAELAMYLMGSNRSVGIYRVRFTSSC